MLTEHSVKPLSFTSGRGFHACIPQFVTAHSSTCVPVCVNNVATSVFSANDFHFPACALGCMTPDSTWLHTTTRACRLCVLDGLHQSGVIPLGVMVMNLQLLALETPVLMLLALPA